MVQAIPLTPISAQPEHYITRLRIDLMNTRAALATALNDVATLGFQLSAMRTELEQERKSQAEWREVALDLRQDKEAS